MAGQGIRCIIYFDDGINDSLSKRDTAYACLTVREDLEASFTLNEEKSCFYPTQIGEWLGFTLHTVTCTLTVPD